MFARLLVGNAEDGSAMVAAGMALAGPVALAEWHGNIAPGLVAALGALLVGGGTIGADRSDQVRRLAPTVATATVAVSLATLVGGHGGASIGIGAVIAVIAALVGGYARGLAVEGVRFVVFLFMVLPVFDGVYDVSVRAGLIALGVGWAVSVSLGVGAMARGLRLVSPSPPMEKGRRVPASHRLRRWRESLRLPATWRYPTQLGLSLAAAALVEAALAHHYESWHLGWIPLTIALVTRRGGEGMNDMVGRRVIGVGIGVIVAWPLIGPALGRWYAFPLVALLAAARARSGGGTTMFGAAVTTPLVVVILAGGRPPDAAVVVERLVATLIAAGLVLTTDRFAKRLIAPSSRGEP